MRVIWIIGAALCLAAPAPAQQSASFKLEEYAFNAGGHPDGGAVATSASFTVSLDAIGEGLAAGGAASPSFLMSNGFPAAYPPPGEVGNLRFTGLTTLAWDADGSTGDYALYRGSLGPPIDPGYGSCVLPAHPGPVSTDTTLPGAGQTLFYLATARNRLGEEGTKGFASTGSERGNPGPCP